MKKTLMIVVLTLLLLLVSVFTGCTEEDPGYAFIVDTDGDVAIVDDNTGAIVTVEYPHYQIHAGNHFQYSEVVDLPINNVLDIQKDYHYFYYTIYFFSLAFRSSTPINLKISDIGTINSFTDDKVPLLFIVLKISLIVFTIERIP